MMSTALERLAMLEKPVESNLRETRGRLTRGMKLLMGWTLANTIAFVAGRVFLELLSGAHDRFFQAGYPDVDAVIIIGIFGFSLGMAIGFMQWSQIRRYLPGVKGWFLATLASTLIASFIGSLIDGAVKRSFPDSVVVGSAVGWFPLMLGGAALGLGQRSVLRNRSWSSWVWVIGVAFSWCTAWVSAKAVRVPIYVEWRGAAGLSGSPGLPAEAIVYAFGGLVFGVMTGLVLIWLNAKLEPKQYVRP